MMKPNRIRAALAEQHLRTAFDLLTNIDTNTAEVFAERLDYLAEPEFVDRRWLPALEACLRYVKERIEARAEPAKPRLF